MKLLFRLRYGIGTTHIAVRDTIYLVVFTKRPFFGHRWESIAENKRQGIDKLYAQYNMLSSKGGHQRKNPSNSQRLL